ncbi:MAG: tetratricopeptide repeat protein [Thermodesulfobacteriota bacterium]
MQNKMVKSGGFWALLTIAAALAAALMTGCAATGETEKTSPADTAVVQPEQLGCGEWVRRKVENSYILGKGDTTILVLAGIGGGEPAAATLARELKTALENKPIPNREVILVIHEEEDIRRAFTEETDHPRADAIMRLVEGCRPERIISLRQLFLEGFDPDGPNEAFQIARMMSDYTYPDAAVSDLPTSPGSLGRFGEIKGIPVVTVAISSRNAGAGGEYLWQRFGYPITAAIRFPDAPDDMPIHARIERGIGYLNAGDVDNAIRTFEALRVRDPSRVEVTEYLFQAHLQAAQQARRSEDLRTARHHNRKALKIRPDCRVCKDLREEIALAEKPEREAPDQQEIDTPEPEPPVELSADAQPAEPEPAEEEEPPPPDQEMGAPPKPDPEQAEALLTEAKSRFEAGEYAKAQEILKAALDADPDCTTCREYLNRARESAAALQAGLAHLEASAYKPAIIQFTWIRDYNPEDANLIPHLVAAYSGFGNQLFARGAYEKAGEQFEKALAVDEACRDCMAGFDQSLEADMSMKNGTYLFEQGEYEQAIPKYANVLRLNPEDRTARQQLVTAYRSWGEKLCEGEDWTGGIARFESALTADPDCLECKNRLRDCVRAFNTRQYQTAKDLVVKQRLGEALAELTRVPFKYRSREVTELIERLEPFASP